MTSSKSQVPSAQREHSATVRAPLSSACARHMPAASSAAPRSGEPRAELLQRLPELLADIARVITPGIPGCPAERWGVVAFRQHLCREHRHLFRRNRVKPEPDGCFTGLHSPMVPYPRGWRETLNGRGPALRAREPVSGATRRAGSPARPPVPRFWRPHNALWPGAPTAQRPAPHGGTQTTQVDHSSQLEAEFPKFDIADYERLAAAGSCGALERRSSIPASYLIVDRF